MISYPEQPCGNRPTHSVEFFQYNPVALNARLWLAYLADSSIERDLPLPLPDSSLFSSKTAPEPEGSILALSAYFSAPYPNPANDRFSVSVPAFAQGHYTLRVLDLTSGKLLYVLEKELTGLPEEYSVPVSSIPAGVYIVQQLFEGEVLRTDKVVVAP